MEEYELIRQESIICKRSNMQERNNTIEFHNLFEQA